MTAEPIISEEKCQICQAVAGPGVHDGACEPCFNRVSAYLGSRKCFPDDLPMAAAFDRMVLLDRTMARLNIAESNRVNVCRNLTWVLMGDRFPEDHDALCESIKSAAHLLEAQRRVG